MPKLLLKHADNIDFLTDEWYTEFFHPKLEWNEDDLWYKIELDDLPVALGFVRGWHDSWPEKVLGIVVHPNYRNMGLGQTLVKALVCITRLSGEKKLRLHVSPENIPASLLYIKEGFETEDKRGDGELIMRKEL